MSANEALREYRARLSSLGPLAEAARGNGSDCPACRGIGYVRNDARPGEPGFGTLAPCECKRSEIAARRVARLADISGLSEQEQQLTLEQFVERAQDTPEMVEVVRGFIDEPFGFLTLWGGPGNGKTLALMAAVNEFRRKGLVSVYVTFVDLLDYMREGFKRDADFDARDRYEQIARADVLAIDEIDKANMTLYAYEFRTRLLDDRYRAAVELRKHTMFALNASPEATMEPHLYDRLHDGRFKVFRNQDPSMRPAMAKLKGF